MVKSAATGCRQQLEMDRKEQDEHDAHPEIGCGLTDQGKYSSPKVPPGAAFDGGKYAYGDANGDREHERHRGQLQGRRKPLNHYVDCRPGLIQRGAEVAPNRRAKP